MMWDNNVEFQNSQKENTSISKKENGFLHQILPEECGQQNSSKAVKKHKKKKMHMFSNGQTLENFGFIGLTMPVIAIAPDIYKV